MYTAFRERIKEQIEATSDKAARPFDSGAVGSCLRAPVGGVIGPYASDPEAFGLAAYVSEAECALHVLEQCAAGRFRSRVGAAHQGKKMAQERFCSAPGRCWGSCWAGGQASRHGDQARREIQRHHDLGLSGEEQHWHDGMDMKRCASRIEGRWPRRHLLCAAALLSDDGSEGGARRAKHAPEVSS